MYISIRPETSLEHNPLDPEVELRVQRDAFGNVIFYCPFVPSMRWIIGKQEWGQLVEWIDKK